MMHPLQQMADVPLSDRFKRAHILIVDDEPANVRLLERVLQRAGHEALVSTTDSREVLGLCQSQTPDLILLDLMMPHLDGFAVMEALHPILQREIYLPILVLTADITPEARNRALSSGAKDFLTKPFEGNEVLLRARNLLETRFVYQHLQGDNRLLEERVRERTHQLEESHRIIEESQIEVLERLAQAAEFRDDDTGQHTYRVGENAARLAEKLGWNEDRVLLMRRAAPLHDVGKIGISDTILLKPGKLSPEEFAVIKTHAAIGGALLQDGKSALVRLAQSIALSHHERWDGGGYPNGLSEGAIPPEGRIVAIVDVFDALTNERPYKKAWPREEALAEIEKQSGQQFDPAAVAAFLEMARETS